MAEEFSDQTNIEIVELDQKTAQVIDKYNIFVSEAYVFGVITSSERKTYLVNPFTGSIRETESDFSIFEKSTEETDDLLDLTVYEYSKYREFKINYDDKVLLDLEPLSICKMYLYAKLIEDYETEYELFTTDENYLGWSKKQHFKDAIAAEKTSIEDKMDALSVFKKIYNLKIMISEDEKTAQITWSSENGYVDEQQGAWVYTFALTRDGEIWKVCFLPMQ